MPADLPDGPQDNNFGLFGGLTRLSTPPALGVDVIAFSNCDHEAQRRNGAVWLSVDGGERWVRARALCHGEFGYSSLACGRAATASGGWLYCFFEAGRASRYYETGSIGRLARFNVAWLVAEQSARA